MNLDRKRSPSILPRTLPPSDLGATGDLRGWKLIPAIGNLARANRLPSRFVTVGFAFDPLTAESFRQRMMKSKSSRPRPSIPSFASPCSRALSGSKICDRRRGWRRLSSPESSPEPTRQWSILGIGMLVVAFGQCAVRIGFFAWCSAEGIQ